MKIVIDFEPKVVWKTDDIWTDHVAEYPDAYDKQPETCEVAYVLGPLGETLASLGCIDDADDNYRADIEAELIAEALHEIARVYAPCLQFHLEEV